MLLNYISLVSTIREILDTNLFIDKQNLATETIGK